MALESALTFGVTDYCLFAGMLAVSLGIGVTMSFKGNNTPEDFLLGSRSIKPIPVAMSLLTSMVSSISLLGFTGETYAYGLQFSLFVAGTILAFIFCYCFILPVLFPLKLVSANEYIKMRFRSKGLQGIVLLLSCLQGFLYAGVYLYAPTIALSSVTPLDSKTYIYILGILCTLYSSIGGIRAVVWTDVVQLIIVVIGLVVITTLGCLFSGGIGNVWSIANDGGRFEVFNMNFGIYERHTFFSVILYGFFYLVANFGVSQINVQRIGCVQTINDAKLVVLINIFGYLIINFLIFTCGIICYATYAGCDPVELGKITKNDQIMSFFVIDKLGYIVGLPGLFIATLVGGSLSSISSVISAQVSMIWKDFLLNFKFIEDASPLVATVVNKVLSMLVGTCLIGIALWASQAKNLLDISLAVSGASSGPVLGVFILGIFFPKCNTMGAWGGLIVSWLLVSWIAVGGFLYRLKSVPLPVSISNCSESTLTSNITIENIIFAQNENGSHYSYDTAVKGTNNLNNEFQFPLMMLYGISSNFYAVIGPLVCIIIGLIISSITGQQSTTEVSPSLIAPFVRRFYWHKKDIQVEKNIQLERTLKE